MEIWDVFVYPTFPCGYRFGVHKLWKILKLAASIPEFCNEIKNNFFYGYGWLHKKSTDGPQPNLANLLLDWPITQYTVKQMNSKLSSGSFHFIITGGNSV